jgi:hypothetical protein
MMVDVIADSAGLVGIVGTSPPTGWVVAVLGLAG